MTTASDKVELSILELGRVREGSDRRTALDDIESYWSPQEKAQASQMLAVSIVGGPDTVRAGMQALVERTGADELMVVSDVFDPALRRRSFRIISEVRP